MLVLMGLQRLLETGRNPVTAYLLQQVQLLTFRNGSETWGLPRVPLKTQARKRSGRNPVTRRNDYLPT
jgi:hypothetical protein